MSAGTGLYLSRARLRHDAPVAALRALLSSADAARAAAGHRLVWTLFGDDPDRRRDFLWREAEPGTFYLLSARPPEDHRGLFRIDPPKPFSPTLAPGDRLRFVLRANATVARKAQAKTGANGRTRGGRCDIVMDALHDVAPGERAEARRALLLPVATRWLAAQGEKSGFRLAERENWIDWEEPRASGGAAPALEVVGYRVLRVDRGRGRPRMEFGVLDVDGTLVVTDPERFIAALGHGFGRAKAFGCGLMLIRRAPSTAS